MWVGLHVQIAQLTENPELVISEADGKEFLLRTQNVMRHYPLVASQKAIDWAAWAFVASFIYVPRAAAIAKRRSTPGPGHNQGPPMDSVHYMYPPPPAPAGAHRGNGSAQPDFASPPPIPPTVDMDIEPEMETTNC